MCIRDRSRIAACIASILELGGIPKGAKTDKIDWISPTWRKNHAKKCKTGELRAVRRSLHSKNSLSLFSATKQKDDDLIILVLTMLWFYFWPLCQLAPSWQRSPQHRGTRSESYIHWLLGTLTVKLTNPWTSEIFMECYCVARNYITDKARDH